MAVSISAQQCKLQETYQHRLAVSQLMLMVFWTYLRLRLTAPRLDQRSKLSDCQQVIMEFALYRVTIPLRV